MPDLSKLDSLITALFTAVMGFRGEKLTDNERSYVRIFAHTTQKAINDYEIAREFLVAQVMSIQLSKIRKESGKLWYMMFGFECYIENCINATRRLYHILDAVKAEKKCGGKLSLDRQMRRNLEAQSKEIIDVRDGVEHIDDIIQKSEVTGSIVLSISDDEEGIELAGYYVRFVDLALVLNRFHELARKWLQDFCKKAT
jgi:hypothetical protein